jgi:hypothetical protein
MWPGARRSKRLWPHDRRHERAAVPHLDDLVRFATEPVGRRLLLGAGRGLPLGGEFPNPGRSRPSRRRGEAPGSVWMRRPASVVVGVAGNLLNRGDG